MARLHVGREAVDVVDALDLGAAVGAVFLQHARQLIHGEVKFERHAERVGCRERAPLEGLLHETMRELPLAKKPGGLVELFFRGELETERFDVRVGRFAQDHGMMIALLEPTQIKRLRALVGHEIAQRVDPIGPGARKIRRAIFDMARAHDGEGRV